jgi:DNA-binding transcriptional regulator YiaG
LRCEELQAALSNILQGIRDSWDLSVPKMACVLHIPERTMKDWLKEDGFIDLKTEIDHNTQKQV